MRKLMMVAALAGIVLPAISSDLSACGESMFRLGKGVQYHTFTAPIPGIVLVYARTDEERAVAEQLQEAGHSVQIVSNDLDLALEMQNRQFDVVVAPYSKRDEVEAQSTPTGKHPDWVPVVENGTAEAKLAHSQYGYTVTADDDVRKYLKAIHKNLKAKST
jgi:hypothetical protein